MIDIAPVLPGSAEYHDLVNGRGVFADAWLRTWNALPSHSRDLCTHPVWIGSFLRSIDALPVALRKVYPITLFYCLHDGEPYTGIPLVYAPLMNRLPGFYQAKGPKLIAGSSLAVSADMLEEVVRALFQARLRGKRPPLVVTFDQVDVSNPLYTTNICDIQVPNGFRALLRLDEGCDRIFVNLHRKTRQKLNRSARKLASQGDYRLEVQHETAALMAALERYMGLEQSGWKGDSPYTLKNNALNQAFYRHLIEGMSMLGRARICELWLDETLLASQVALVIGDTLHSLKIAYNEQYAAYSPGNLLTAKVLKDYMETRKLMEFNCVSESEWFLKTWRSDTRGTAKCMLFADSAGGALLRMGYDMYRKLKQTAHARGNQ